MTNFSVYIFADSKKNLAYVLCQSLPFAEMAISLQTSDKVRLVKQVELQDIPKDKAYEIRNTRATPTDEITGEEGETFTIYNFVEGKDRLAVLASSLNIAKSYAKAVFGKELKPVRVTQLKDIKEALAAIIYNKILI